MPAVRVVVINGTKPLPMANSYSANSLACPAALTSLKLLQEQEAHKNGISNLKDLCPNIEHTPILGTISAFKVKNLNNLNAQLKISFRNNGLLLRPLGNVIYHYHHIQ